MEVDDDVVDLSVSSRRERDTRDVRDVREPVPQVTIMPVGLPSTLEIRPVPLAQTHPQDLTRGLHDSLLRAQRHERQERPNLHRSGSCDILRDHQQAMSRRQIEISRVSTETTMERQRDKDRGTTLSVVPMGAPRAPPLEPNTTTTTIDNGRYPRRSLRPRQERSYAESPDVVMLSDEEPRINGFTNGLEGDDSDDGAELPPIPSPPIKELSETELNEKERVLRKLREELRNEEMKLVLLKKLRQSQQMKENIAVPNQPPAKVPDRGTNKLPPPHHIPPPLVRGSPGHKTSSNVPPLLRGQPPPRQNMHAPPPLMMAPQNNRTSSSSSLPPNILLAQQSLPRGTTLGIGSSSNSRSSSSTPATSSISLTTTQDRPKDSTPTTPTTPQPERTKQEDHQTPAQRQAAAKLALRKQLEKTLLQIPPPKPPPPEMHFIPNPSNTEFVYLLGLEHIVDFITRDNKVLPPPEPFKCSQCHTDFTPVWKWEKNPTKGKDPKVICEQCVTTNVKKALKAEHTNRLKTAFVKALQQEQEIEQRLAQVSASPQPETNRTPPAPSPKPAPVVPLAVPTPKPSTPTGGSSRHGSNTPTTTSQPAPTPPLSHRDHPLAKLAAETSKFNSHHAAAALQQQLLRGLPPHQPLPAHMLPFSPLLYPYQLMAQVAGSKGSVAAAAANLAELQRQAADLQRQYLLDMIPQASPSSSRGHHNNWKT